MHTTTSWLEFSASLAQGSWKEGAKACHPTRGCRPECRDIGHTPSLMRCPFLRGAIESFGNFASSGDITSMTMPRLRFAAHDPRGFAALFHWHTAIGPIAGLERVRARPRLRHGLAASVSGVRGAAAYGSGPRIPGHIRGCATDSRLDWVAFASRPACQRSVESNPARLSCRKLPLKDSRT